MKTSNRLNLSHIAGFFLGVVVTVLFNWLAFKDPKKITAPGVASLLAMCTFSLALWSAYRVNEWIKTKINDAGFKQCELAMETLRNMVNNLNYISQLFKRLKTANKKNGEFERIAADLEPLYESFIKNGSDLLLIMESLPSWNIKIIVKPIILKAFKLLTKNQFTTIIKSSLAYIAMDHPEKDEKVFFAERSKQIILTVDAINYKLVGILSMPYYKKFEHL